MRYTRNGLATAGIAAALLASSVPMAQVAYAEGPYSTALWVGVGLQEDVLAAYAGGVWAANGSLNQTGILIRGQAIYVDYEFDSALAASGEADGEVYRANALVGYQLAGDGVVASVFGGVDFQDRDISPSAADSGRLNDEIGFMIAGRVATSGPTNIPASLEGNYSTANDSYWARARIGYRIDQISVGPELSLLGNDGFDAVRYGGYAAFDFGGTILQVNAGYGDASGTGGSNGGRDGVYGGGTVVFLF